MGDKESWNGLENKEFVYYLDMCYIVLCHDFKNDMF